MIFTKAKSKLLHWILQNRSRKNSSLWIFYLIGLSIVFALKYYYSKAGSDDLQWILAPTAGWVRILSGIPFEPEPHVGYINHHFQFIIAASCSGVQFMLITIATLIFSFVHRMKTAGRCSCWLILSIGCAYLFTIFVNGLRIVAAIYIPLYLEKAAFDRSVITPERLHTIIGIVVYFTALYAIYSIADHVSRTISRSLAETTGSARSQSPVKPWKQLFLNYMPPAFWYFSIALGVPFLNNACGKNQKAFIEYAALMTAVCLTILSVLCLAAFLRKQLPRRLP